MEILSRSREGVILVQGTAAVPARTWLSVLGRNVADKLQQARGDHENKELENTPCGETRNLHL